MVCMESLPEESSSSKLDPMYLQSIPGTDELNVQSLAQSDYDIATEGESEAGISFSKLDPMSVQSVSGTNELNVQSLAQSDYDIVMEGESEAGQDRFSEFFSLGGTRKIWIPEDVDDVKPKLFSKYLSIEDAMDMYRAYAAKVGFDVRKGSTKIHTKSRVLTHRSMLCNREGFPQTVYVDTTDSKNNKPPRNSNIKRKGYPAFAKFRRVGNSNVFELYKFEERHNHDLVAKDYRHFLRVKIGPMKAYKIMQELNGANNVGGTVVDYKNQSRKVNCFIEKDDAQMVVDKYLHRMKDAPTLTFEFICEKGKLVSLFWADEAAKANYREFGDVVSFDATFRTNKYHMVFVHFTTIDNHRKSVTFAIGLLSSETTESYVWLLKTFLKTFGKQPTVVLTDEDAAMKIAIERILSDSRHRLCMWHITQKLPSKVCAELADDMKFKKRFNKLIWNSRIDASEFNIRWRSFIEDYKLQEISWFSKMFHMRESWIPAYFRDMPLSGLTRTTSRSESIYSAFNKISHWGNSLVKFFTSFDSAMDRQRHNQCYLDHLSNIFKIKSKISLKIMEHAADIYTNEVFIKVKKEIEQSLFSCSQYSVTNEEFYDRFVVMQYKDIMGSTPTVVNEEDSESEYDVPEKTYFFKVVYDKKESSFECSRSLFFQNGILCRHIFCIFRTYQINKIPSKYILRRWCKGVIPSEVLMKQCLNDETSSSSSLLYDPLSRQVLIFVEESVSSLSKDTDKLKEFFELIKEAKLKVDGVCSTSISSNSLLKIKDIFEFVESSYGVKKPSISDIGNPSDDISNKGCGTGANNMLLVTIVGHVSCILVSMCKYEDLGKIYEGLKDWVYGQDVPRHLGSRFSPLGFHP
uniref:SWIM-type domain-containing protein n=1 Tax=Lactuca sativa TaxID=4236 RepID=A0A9R1XJV5_LACSA|nr:hypothetical protein LSAT_V11C300147800 [Lactuca sativa]